MTFLLSEEEGENTTTWGGTGLAQARSDNRYVRSSWSSSEDTDMVSSLSALRFFVASLAASPLVSSAGGSPSLLSLVPSADGPSSLLSLGSWLPSG